MLIIAIPKSASTSLLYTLGKLHNLSNQQLEFPSLATPSFIRLLHRYHPDIVELGEQEAAQFGQSHQWYKQHIPPTANNLKRLSSLRKVVLLRQPEDVILGYRRGERSGQHLPKPEFRHCPTDEAWLQTARTNGLYDDLYFFYEGWKQVQDDHTLLIDYHQLITNPENTIHRVEEFFDLPLSSTISLSRKRYSRYTGLQRVSSTVRHAIRSVVTKMGGRKKVKIFQAYLRTQGINIEA